MLSVNGENAEILESYFEISQKEFDKESLPINLLFNMGKSNANYCIYKTQPLVCVNIL